ncbi:hypothetical protein [Brucella sp. 2280]|uniref:hypothetical protein n=1 Tax=Brucella sp. 2280 TaxID=2592625 RepID=UPI001296F445|nr:hypothetical protein [Brucella sp. 2280]QGA55908.1 hypothetical protein GHC20_01910 [Brucella sp. 2280]
MNEGDTLIFTGHGVLNAQADGPEAFLDVIAGIRDEYLKKRGDALDQMEFNAAQGDAKETSFWSTEAERHNASVLAASRILELAEDFFRSGS